MTVNSRKYKRHIRLCAFCASCGFVPRFGPCEWSTILAKIMINWSVPTVGLLVGAAILLIGRKLFWLFVAAVGFAVGAELAPQVIHHPAPVVILVIAFVLGLLGALFAV